MPLSLPLVLLATSGVGAPNDSLHCERAAEFLRDTQRMEVAVDLDTLDDWRTAKRVPGCRVTAAGGSALGVGGEAVRLYERLRSAGWRRTPDARDAPNEASLRFRWQGSDCLFNVYEVPRLDTDAEARVNAALVVAPGDTRYQVLVLCIPAMDSAPR